MSKSLQSKIPDGYWERVLKVKYDLPTGGTKTKWLQNDKCYKEIYISSRYLTNGFSSNSLANFSLFYTKPFKRDPRELIDTLADMHKLPEGTASRLLFQPNSSSHKMPYIFMSSLPAEQKIILWNAKISKLSKDLSNFKFIAALSFNSDGNILNPETCRFLPDGRFFVAFKEDVLRIYDPVGANYELSSENFEFQIRFKESHLEIASPKSNETQIYEYLKVTYGKNNIRWQVKGLGSGYVLVFVELENIVILLDTKQTKIIKVVQLELNNSDFVPQEFWMSPIQGPESLRIYIVDQQSSIQGLKIEVNSQPTALEKSSTEVIFEQAKYERRNELNVVSKKNFEFFRWKQFTNSEGATDACVLYFNTHFLLLDLKSGSKFIIEEVNPYDLPQMGSRGWTIVNNVIFYITRTTIYGFSLYHDYLFGQRMMGWSLNPTEQSHFHILRADGVLVVVSQDGSLIDITVLHPYYFHLFPPEIEKPELQSQYEDSEGSSDELFAGGLFGDDEPIYTDNLVPRDRELWGKNHMNYGGTNVKPPQMHGRGRYATIVTNHLVEPSERILKNCNGLIFFKSGTRMCFVDLTNSIENQKNLKESPSKYVPWAGPGVYAKTKKFDYLNLYHKSKAKEEPELKQEKTESPHKTKTQLKNELKGLSKEEREKVIQQLSEEIDHGEPEDLEKKSNSKLEAPPEKIERKKKVQVRKENERKNDQTLQISKKATGKRLGGSFF